MNKKGKGSGLLLIVILVAALLMAWFAVTQMGSFGFGRKQEIQQEQSRNAVQQAKDIVVEINQRQQDAAQEP